MKYGEIYLSKTWKKLYPISTRVGKPNVADEPFNEQKNIQEKQQLVLYTWVGVWVCKSASQN